jgi:TPR repeat protein
LGHAYLKGLGVERNREEATRWIMKAAGSGHAEAQYDAAYLSAETDHADAGRVAVLEWTKKAAMQGHPMAAFNLGGMYEFGTGIEKNWVEAGKWYVYAGGLGNANGIARLEIMANTCARNPEKGECSNGMSLQDVAGRGDAVSLYRIGLAFRDGDGIRQDYIRSLLWFRHAAGMGNADAQYALGDLYENALGVGRSAAQARFWYARAATLGNTQAAARLRVLKDDKKGNK